MQHSSYADINAGTCIWVVCLVANLIGVVSGHAHWLPQMFWRTSLKFVILKKGWDQSVYSKLNQRWYFKVEILLRYELKVAVSRQFTHLPPISIALLSLNSRLYYNIVDHINEPVHYCHYYFCWCGTQQSNNVNMFSLFRKVTITRLWELSLD